MSPFRNILRLSAGDFLAKTLSFISFVYVARVLGVATYGVLEFALSVMTYFLLLADGGLEIWATRAVAQGQPVAALAGRIVPLRFLLAILAFAALCILVPLLPAYPSLREILLLFGLTLFAQAVSLKWVFMGREQMSTVALGLVAAQIVTSVALLVTVRDPSGLLWIPVVRLAGDTALAGYFAYRYRRAYGRLPLRVTVAESKDALRGAFVMGGAHSLAQVSYNFDSVLLGLLVGSTAVGWYNAAYRPITALLSLPVSYFLGLFPVLSRTFRDNPAEFQSLIGRSLHWLGIFALPVALGGMVWAKPAITFLFGSEYAGAVLPFQVLAWSAALVILRGTFRQALNAAGRQDLDLRCAVAATLLNVTANLLLIPYFGIVGAAVATLLSEVLWLGLVSYFAHRHITELRLSTFLVQPATAATVVAIGLWLMPSIPWLYQIPVAALFYFGMLVALDRNRWRSLLLLS